MLEQLADFDDHLMEELLEEIEPEREEIFRDLTDNLQATNIVSVLLGAAERDNGVQRLLKALRHETPAHADAAERAGADPASGETVAQVLKTYNTQHGGKLSLTRIWSGSVSEGDVLNGERVGSLSRMIGQQVNKALLPPPPSDRCVRSYGRRENRRRSGFRSRTGTRFGTEVSGSVCADRACREPQ